MNAGFEQWEPNPDNLLADVSRQTATAQATAGATDARGMLRQARSLFQQQRLDEAEKLAVQAENVPNSRWGLFEDSPRKLRDEIVRSRSQMDSDRANKLTIDARAALKRGDVAQARVQAQQAKSLQGTSSVFAMWADTPDAVLRDVARAEKLHPTPTNPNMPPPLPEGPTLSRRRPAARGLPIAPAARRSISAEANNAAKQRAVGLLVEARQHSDQGHLAEARLKALEAEKVPAIWSPAEDCPVAVLRELDTRASALIKHLLEQATDLVLKNGTDPTRFEKADGYLLTARRLAESFRLDSAAIDQKSQWIQQVANQSRLDPTAPGPIIRAAQAQGRSTSEMSEPVVRDASAKLDQARRELKAGDIELARKLAVDAYALVQNGASPQVLEEASRVLHSIDQEEHNQTILSARRNFMNAMEAYRQKDYRQSAMLLSSFDIRLLPPDQVRRVEEIMSTPEMLSVQAKSRGDERIKQVAAVAPGAAPPSSGQVGIAHATDLEDPQIAALREAKLLEYQKYRQKKLSAEYVAETQLKDGSPKQAVETLTDCLTQLKTSGMDAADIEKLSPAVEKRINDIQSAQAKADLEREQKLAIKQPWNEEKYQEARKKTQEQIAVLMEKGRELYKEGKYEDALVQAKLVQELEPSSEAGKSLELMAINKRNIVAYENGQKVQSDRVLKALDPGEDPDISPRRPWAVDKGIMSVAMNRGAIELPFIPIKTPKEMAIERKLSQPITLTVQDQPLYRVLQDLQLMTGVNIVPDKAALADKNVSLEQTLSLNVDNISFKSALSLLLRQARLTYVIRNEVIEITTTDNAQGKNRLKTYSVADLVVNNVQDNGTSRHQQLRGSSPKRHIRNGSGGVSYNAPDAVHRQQFDGARGQSVSNPGLRRRLQRRLAVGRWALELRPAGQQHRRLAARPDHSNDRSGDLGGPGRRRSHPVLPARPCHGRQPGAGSAGRRAGPARRPPQAAGHPDLDRDAGRLGVGVVLRADRAQLRRQHPHQQQPEHHQPAPARRLHRPEPDQPQPRRQRRRLGRDAGRPAHAGPVDPDQLDQQPVQQRCRRSAASRERCRDERRHLARSRLPQRHPGLHVPGSRPGRSPHAHHAGPEDHRLQRPDGEHQRPGRHVLPDRRRGGAGGDPRRSSCRRTTRSPSASA